MIIHLAIEVNGTHTKVVSSNLTPPEGFADEEGYRCDYEKAIELFEAWLMGFKGSFPKRK